MIRFSVSLPLTLSAILAAGALLPAVVSAQPQDSQSVAEAARRARAQKKTIDKPPTKVITDDNLVVKKGDVQSAAAEVPKMPGSEETPAQPASGDTSANSPGSQNASDDEKARALLKQRVALKEKIKDTQSDLDLLQREFQLDQDAFYSRPDYANNTSGKAKLDAMKQQISDKQQELDRLKADLAALPAAQESPANGPPKP
jgi:hypothetical protein